MPVGYPIYDGICYRNLYSYEAFEYIASRNIQGYEKDYFIIKKHDGLAICRKVPYDIDFLRYFVDSNIIAYCNYEKALSCNNYRGGPILNDKLLKENIQLSFRDSTTEHTLYSNRKRAKNRFSAINFSMCDNPTEYSLNHYDAAAMLNHRFQWLRTQPNEKSAVNNIRFHGVPTDFAERYDDIEKKEETFKFPKFRFQDYVTHEKITGLSLSIEISSALLEFENQELMKKAWEMFCSHAFIEGKSMLSWVVFSDELCSRASLARMYLLSIRDRYDCSQFGDEPIEIDMSMILQNSFIPSSRRLSWASIPNRLSAEDPRRIVSRNKEEMVCEKACAQRVLSAIEEPFHFDDLFLERSYEELRPEDGHITLAVFCNPQHKYVKEYIANTKEVQHVFGKTQEVFSSIYNMVHSAVMEEIMRQKIPFMYIRISDNEKEKISGIIF